MRVQRFLILLFALLLVASTAMAQQFSVGDRVTADPTGSGKYRAGTIVEVSAPGRQYKIRFDGDRPGYELYVNVERIRGGAPADGAKGTAGAAPDSKRGSEGSASASKATSQAASPTQTAPRRTETAPAAAGKVGNACPPDGTYKASKIGAGVFSSRPMRVSGGRLTGVPDDWVQVRCESRSEKPLYKVFFRSKSGFNHSIDLDR